MKLFKKLLPIAAVASTAAIIAPIVTSCGITYKYKFDLDHRPTDFKPTVKPVAAKKVKEEDAINEYLNDILKNKKAFADDAVYWLTRMIPEEVSGGDIEVKVEKISKSSHKLSFEYSVNLIYINPIHLVMKNIEYTMVYYDGIWRILPYYFYLGDISLTMARLYLQSHDDWSYTLDRIVSTPAGNKVIPYRFDSKSPVEDLESLIRGGMLARYVWFGSYHWQNVELDEEK